MLPEVFATPEDRFSAIFVLAGYLAVHLAQHVLTPHFHFGEEPTASPRPPGDPPCSGSCAAHLFDGVAIASGFVVSCQAACLLALAVLLHKLPEGVTIASLVVAGGGTRRRAMLSAGILGCATILGVLLTEKVRPLAQHGLALAAGVTLYVAASNLVPEFQAKRGWQTVAAFFGGTFALP